jgi:hypothetical protein
VTEYRFDNRFEFVYDKWLRTNPLPPVQLQREVLEWFAKLQENPESVTYGIDPQFPQTGRGSDIGTTKVFVWYVITDRLISIVALDTLD